MTHHHAQPAMHPLCCPLSSARLAAMAAALSVPDGGFTVDPDTSTDARTGYAVSIYPACERVYLRRVTADDLADYLTLTPAFFALMRPGRVFGGWRDPDTGRIHLDVSAVLPTVDAAFDLGRRAGQLAVFDLAAGHSIPIPAHTSDGETSRDTAGHPVSPAIPERDSVSRPVSPVSAPVPLPVSPTDPEVTTPPDHDTPADAAKEIPAMPASTPRPHHTTNNDTDADNGAADTGGVVLPFRRPSTRDHTWTIEGIDTEPLTAQQHDQAVTALAALIGQWQNRRDSSGSNEKAA